MLNNIGPKYILSNTDLHKSAKNVAYEPSLSFITFLYPRGVMAEMSFGVETPINLSLSIDCVPSHENKERTFIISVR